MLHAVCANTNEIHRKVASLGLNGDEQSVYANPTYVFVYYNVNDKISSYMQFNWRDSI